MIDTNNLWTGTGGLTSDPEYNEGLGLVKFSIAIDGAGYEDKQRTTGYFDVEAWVKPNKFSPVAFGEYVLSCLNDKTLAKGSKVTVTGSLRHSRFMTKDGAKASKVTITAENVRVLFSKEGANRRQADSASSGGTATATTASSAPEANTSDSEGQYNPEPF